MVNDEGINLSKSKYKLCASLSTERGVADCRWKEKKKEKRAWMGGEEDGGAVVLHTKGPRRPRGIVLTRGGAHLHLGEPRSSRSPFSTGEQSVTL